MSKAQRKRIMATVLETQGHEDLKFAQLGEQADSPQNRDDFEYWGERGGLWFERFENEQRELNQVWIKPDLMKESKIQARSWNFLFSFWKR